MGIIRLMEFIKTKYPSVLTIKHPKQYKKKVLAIDTTISIYKYLIKTITLSNFQINAPTDSQGNQTGHLIGLLYQALMCLEYGIKPIWVFDGVPPKQKIQELGKRKRRKDKALLKEQQAISEGNMQQVIKQSKRTIEISSKEKLDAEKMLTLIGMPIVKAKTEAESQCSWLVKNNLADVVVTGDTDALAFGAPRFIRSLNRNSEIIEIQLQDLLKEMKLKHSEFIDFCIMCGCDYSSKIQGIGCIKAYQLISEYRTIQNVIDYLLSDTKMRNKYQIQDNFNFLRARQLFEQPVVTQVKQQQLQWKPIDENGLTQFLLEKQFGQKRIENWLKLAKQFQTKQYCK